MNIYELTVNDYLDAASSKSSTPGGGSVSAVVAANASAMVSMVANLTLGKKGYDDVQDVVRSILEVMNQNMTDIKVLTEKDMQAFQNFMVAWRLPSATEEEKSAKSLAMEKAAQNASSVPLELCSACIEVLRQAARLAPIGNKTAISDVGVAAYLAEAALNAAMLSVDINLPMIGDEAFKERLLTEKARLLLEAEELKSAALSDVRKRLS
jgi:formiminotetrahydrofolate cyclodeaminase